MSSPCKNFSFNTSLQDSIEGSELWVDPPAPHPRLIREKITEGLRVYSWVLVSLFLERPE
jgi:hypothetical protein